MTAACARTSPAPSTSTIGWTEFYETSPHAIRQACDAVGGNRTAAELKLAAPQA